MSTLVHRWQEAAGRRRKPAPHPRLLTVEPGERDRPDARRLRAAFAIAVGLPIVAAILLIPLRADHAGTAAVLMIVPVVLAATLGTTGPALVAAVTAGLAYDYFLTEPYQRLTIDDADDIVAAITLVVVGSVVGVLSSRNVHLAARSARRRDELRHVSAFSRSSASGVGVDELRDEACRRVADLLNATECRWRADPAPSGVPVLLADGNVMGPISALGADRAKLPARVELPARAGGIDAGSFSIVAGRDRVTSFEERMTAATIASLYAAAVLRTAPPGTN